MQRTNQYTFDSRVRFSEVDHTKQMTLPGIINYFQDCSMFQSESLGYGVDYFTNYGKAWVLSYWQVEVKRYPAMGEKIKVSTWATEFSGLLGLRNFCMKDEEGAMIAYANSVWAYMDLQKGRPCRPSKEEVAAYGIGTPLEMEYKSRKIDLPKETKEGDAFPVRKYHIDTNEHVNNCQYVQMALEMIPEDSKIKELRVEYKKSAVIGDVIYPKVAMEEDRMVVELCDEGGNPYAVVELKEE